MTEPSSVDEQGGSTQSGLLRLRLYVAGRLPNSVQALANLHAICQEYLDPSSYELEVVDVLEEPKRALADGILLTPTLITLSPPRVSITGSLNDRERVAHLLGLTPQGGCQAP